jgi:hypothetical protein
MGRLKRDADVHRPDRFFNLHPVEVVTQHSFLAVQYRRQRTTDFAESDDQGSRLRLAAGFFFHIHRISPCFSLRLLQDFRIDNHAVRSESIAR